MKSLKNLFAKMLNAENVEKCIYKASVGKRSRPDVKWVLEHIDEMILAVQEMIQDGTYQDNIPHHIPFKINDGVSRKVRYIIKPNFSEQIVHHLMMSAVKDKIMQGMYELNCGSIPRRGGTYAKEATEKYIKAHQKDGKVNYCLKIDIHHFFQSISHQKLKTLLFKNIKDQKLLDLFYATIDAYEDHHDENDRYGIPIGFYTSQWLANWYLQGLDHYIKQNLKAGFYVRYMDDMVIFGSSKEELRYILNEIIKYLGDLKLILNKKWQIFPFDNRVTSVGKLLKRGRCVDFVGFKFYRDRTILRKNLMLRGTRKARKIKKQRDCNWYEATQFISSYGWFKNCNTKHCMNKWVWPYIRLESMRRKISKHKKKLIKIEREPINKVLRKWGLEI